MAFASAAEWLPAEVEPGGEQHGGLSVMLLPTRSAIRELAITGSTKGTGSSYFDMVQIGTARMMIGADGAGIFGLVADRLR